MAHEISPYILQTYVHDGAEIALLDVREHGQYGESHLFFAVSTPYSRLELDVVRLAPRRSVRMVLVDDDGKLAYLAASRLEALGYTNVLVLAGGVHAWELSGFPVFAGVNVPSKAFGELVEIAYGTPHVTIEELARMREAGANLLVLDGRPFGEYQKMSIPGAMNCPNGELALRFEAIVQDPQTTVVINCAGRTRSIVGAQTLIDLEVSNPVFALENGTQGWFLSDRPLAHGQAHRYPDVPQPPMSSRLRAQAKRLADRAGVAEVDGETVAAWVRDANRTTFILDVRSPEEFLLGSFEGAVHAPGGQLVQTTDQYIGVRHARLVLVDDDGIRARVSASWLRRMGHDASSMTSMAGARFANNLAAPRLAVLRSITAVQLDQMMRDSRVHAVDLRRSMDFRRAHVSGAEWSIRPRIASQLADVAVPVVLIADDIDVARFAAMELSVAQTSRVLVLEGGFAAWCNAGLSQSSSPDVPPDRECIDFLFFAHDRHEGNKDAARQYLAWEQGLVSRLHPDDRASFRLPT